VYLPSDEGAVSQPPEGHGSPQVCSWSSWLGRRTWGSPESPPCCSLLDWCTLSSVCDCYLPASLPTSHTQH